MRLSRTYRRLRRWIAKAENWWLPAIFSDLSKKFDVPVWVFWAAFFASSIWRVGDIYFHAGDLAFFCVTVPSLSICLFQQAAAEFRVWLKEFGAAFGLVVRTQLTRLPDPLRAVELSVAAARYVGALPPAPPLVGRLPTYCLSKRLLPIPLAVARQAGG